MSGSFHVDRQRLADGGRIARLVIDNRQKLNTLNRELMKQIVSAMADVAVDPELRLAILTGAGGRAFVGGADLDELASLDRNGAEDLITLVHHTCDAFRRLPVPVIARIEGYTLGAGLELACACDLRVASEDAKFGMPEVGIGIPSVVEAALLLGIIGAGRTRRLLYTAEMIDAKTALEWGLVDIVTPRAELDAAVDSLARPILAAGPRSIRLQKALIQEWEELPASAAIERGIASFLSAHESEEPRQMAGAALARLRGRRR